MGARDDDHELDDGSITAGRRPVPDFVDGEMTQAIDSDADKTVVGKPGAGGRGGLGVRPIVPHQFDAGEEDASGATVRLDVHPDEIIPVPKVETVGEVGFSEDEDPTLGITGGEDLRELLSKQARRPERTDPSTRMPTSPGALLTAERIAALRGPSSADPAESYDREDLFEPDDEFDHPGGFDAEVDREPETGEADYDEHPEYEPQADAVPTARPEASPPARGADTIDTLGEHSEAASHTLGEIANEPIESDLFPELPDLPDLPDGSDLEYQPEDPGSVTATFHGKLVAPKDLTPALDEGTEPDADERRRAARPDSLLSRIGTPVKDDSEPPAVGYQRVEVVGDLDDDEPGSRSALNNRTWWLAALALSLMAVGIVLVALIYKGMR